MTFTEQHSGLDTLTTQPLTKPSKREKDLIEHQSEHANKIIFQKIQEINTIAKLDPKLSDKLNDPSGKNTLKNTQDTSTDIRGNRTQRETEIKEQREKAKEGELQDQKWLKGIFAQTIYDIENTGKSDDKLQKLRGISMTASLTDKILKLNSYKHSTDININTGQLAVYNKTGDKLTFPLILTLDKDSETNTFLDNQKNRTKVDMLYRLANLINRGQYLSTQIQNKSADDYEPFHLEEKGTRLSGFHTIEIQNGLSDLQLIKVQNLAKYAKIFNINKDTFINTLINFLNQVHKTNYQPNNPTKGKLF